MKELCDHPEIVAFRPSLPEPICTWVAHSRNVAGWTTAVTRLFPPDVAYCGRCPRNQCNVEHGICLISIQDYISDNDAPGLMTFGRPLPDSPLDGLAVHDGAH